MTRAFVAVTLDEPTRATVAAEIERLRPLCQAVAWVPASNLHLTLQFLGEQDEERLADAVRALDEAATSAFTLTLHGLGAFPGMERPRILWIGAAEGALSLRTVQSGVAAALERRRFLRDAKPWHPHLTIGRVFDPRRWRREAGPPLRQAIAQAATADFGRLTVSRVVLMRSDLSPKGARYSELYSVSLGGT